MAAQRLGTFTFLFSRPSFPYPSVILDWFEGRLPSRLARPRLLTRPAPIFFLTRPGPANETSKTFQFREVAEHAHEAQDSSGRVVPALISS